MERFKKILKRALQAKADRLDLVDQKVPSTQSGAISTPLPEETAVTQDYLRSIAAVLFPKAELALLAQNAPTKSSLQVPPFGKVTIFAPAGNSGPLAFFLPPNGDLELQKAWAEFEKKPAPPPAAPPAPPPQAAHPSLAPAAVVQSIPFTALAAKKIAEQEKAAAAREQALKAKEAAAFKAALINKIAPAVPTTEPKPIPLDVTQPSPLSRDPMPPQRDQDSVGSDANLEPSNGDAQLASAPALVATPEPPSPIEPAAPPPITMPTMPQAPLAAAVSHPTPFIQVLQPRVGIRPGPHPIDDLLRLMVSKGASDLHLTSGEPLCMRINGDMERIGKEPITAQIMDTLYQPIIPADNFEEFSSISDTDFAYELAGVGRFRVNLFRDRQGVGMVLRYIPSKILTMTDLALPAAISQFCYLSKGLVVVTGPTGSGKSTTLAAIIDQINKTRQDHILTIEDPIEFVHPQQQCLINQREVSKHTKSFARALKAALREDPDIILIGEMRDLETVSIAIETAETGHLVFGTLHTTTAVSTVDRIIDQFSADRQEQIRTMLAASLKGVVAQTLLKKKAGGRIAAHEILVVTDTVAAMIREGKSHMVQNHMVTQKSDGNQLLNTVLVDLVLKDVVSVEEAYLKAVAKKDLLMTMKQKGVDVSVLEQTHNLKISA